MQGPLLSTPSFDWTADQSETSIILEPDTGLLMWPYLYLSLMVTRTKLKLARLPEAREIGTTSVYSSARQVLRKSRLL